MAGGFLNVYGAVNMSPFLQVKVNEASRLATALSNIDKDASVVPRGAFTKSPSGKVQTNRSFGGMFTAKLLAVQKCLYMLSTRNQMQLCEYKSKVCMFPFLSTMESISVL